MERNEEGLIVASLLDGTGGGEVLDWAGVSRWSPGDGLLWVHLDYDHPVSRRWLRDQAGLDALVAEALMAEETRPRSLVIDGGILAALRGVNLNPGADPEDMVSIRLWSDGRRIVTARHRQLLSVTDLRESLARGRGPRTAAEFLVELSSRLVERMSEVIERIDESVDELETQVLTLQSHQLRPLISAVRREAIGLRRYLAPQREAMTRLFSERVEWLDEVDRLRLREVADRTTRYVEDLDMARERAVVVQEELMSRLSEQLDRRMYLLSLVAVVFLPLGFLTGLFGVNVEGIPGAHYKWAFLVFSALLVLLVGGQLLWFRRKRWL